VNCWATVIRPLCGLIIAFRAKPLGVLLLTWNQAFYRYGIFDFDDLEVCITRNLRLLRKLNETKDMVKKLQSSVNPEPLMKKTLLKLIDEYNYAKYTKRWI
jgi:hypothetical protein